MILTAHQPVFLPWLGLFHKIALADRFVSFNGVQYQPKDWNNRNRIKTAKGAEWLTVPVLRKGYLDKTIDEIEINNAVPWRRKLWETLRHAYGKTPYFSRYADYFEDVIAKREWLRLVDLNESMLQWFLETLGLKIAVESARDFDLAGAKSELVLDMCRKLGATVYIFGELGRGYADVAAFERDGVRPYFQSYRHPVYPQAHGAFISHLSIVDLLFNCGESSLDILMSGNIGRSDAMRTEALAQ